MVAALLVPVQDGPPIIVTGTRVEDTDAELRACLERKCPPGEDIAAALADAETVFVAGDCRQARTVLRRSLGRNRKHSDRYPVPVSDLCAPPCPLNVQAPDTGHVDEFDASQGNPANRFGGSSDGMWTDVGYWVQVSGRVSELQVLRNSGNESWAEPRLKSIRGRRYAPLELPSYRQERSTCTSAREDQTGSHLKRRSPRARVEHLDLAQRETVPSS